MSYSLPDLAYDYGALEPVYSGRVLELHHGKHHAAYVAGLNRTQERLAEARERSDFEAIVGLEKTLAFNLSGHILHSLFWKNLSPDGGGKPDGELATAIGRSFGSFERLRDQLTQATITVQGSGWGSLAWEPVGQQLVVEQIYDHHGNVGSGSIPLLAIDAWEHAYYLQHENRRADYVAALWDLVDWNDVEARFARARAFSLL
ncbi:MAG: superoxide dismutase [Myxococcota bacterium]